MKRALSPISHMGRITGRVAGFTLIEILITAALLAIALGLLFIPLTSSFGYFRTGTAQADAHNAARTALDAMCRELQEAMYVQLDMYDNSVVAFVPPLRVDASDPNSEIVTPPRPDWDHAIRYWRALHDPRVNYSPTGRVGPTNTYYLARTVVEYPFTTDDPWNRWNDNWAAILSAGGAQGVHNWAPIPRVVNSDIDYLGALRTTSLQPGYPYLDIQYQLANGWLPLEQAARPYRDLVVGMTPNAVDYDVTDLAFQPLVVSGEWLSPASGGESDDYSVYRTRYPLLRLGAPYTGWASFAGGAEAIPLPASVRDWARDPFLLIYRFVSGELESGYQLRAIGCFDPRSRTMRVLSYPEVAQVPDWHQAQLYDTGAYPYRIAPLEASSPWVAFGTGLNGWVEGSFRFDFPPPADLPADMKERFHTPDEMEALEPMYVFRTRLQKQALAVGAPVYQVALLNVWEQRSGGDPLAYFLLPDSVRVRIDSDGDGRPDRALTQVYCTPRAGLDQFQVGTEPLAPGGTDVVQPKYGIIRLPERLADGELADTHDLWVDFRWRSNGVWMNGREYPDLICAYYRSAAVLEVSVTVTRADPGARPSQRVAQSAHLTRRVKLHNVLREVSYGAR